MKFEKIPKDGVTIKIELSEEEAKDLLDDLDSAEESINLESGTEEFYKQLKELLK